MKAALEIRTALGLTPTQMAKAMRMRDATTWLVFERAKNPGIKHTRRLIEIAQKHLEWDLSDCLAALYED